MRTRNSLPTPAHVVSRLLGVVYMNHHDFQSIGLLLHETAVKLGQRILLYVVLGMN
jgi:hypothetical protein